MSNHYTYQMPWGFITCEVGVDTPPAEGEYVDKWAINLTEAKAIKQGGDLEVVDDELVVIPSPLPNDGTP